IKRRPLEDDEPLLTFAKLRDLTPVGVEHGHDRNAADGRRRVALEPIARREREGAARVGAIAEFLRFPRVERTAHSRTFALRLHCAVVALAIDPEAALPGEVLHEVERYAERVVQAERLVSAKHAIAGRRAVERFFETGQSVCEDRIETVLFGADDLHD